MKKIGLIFILLVISELSFAACRDAVVLVHGNGGYPSNFDDTYNLLRSKGYATNEIFRPNWGSKFCVACNNHSGSEETPVRNSINAAISGSCTGKIDVIGHSMGVTLAAKQILTMGVVSKVDTFVGIAGGYRGLWSCGTYPFNVPNSTCGSQGLSVNSPLVNSLKGRILANKTYSIKSWVDQVVCSTGICTVGGRHTSQIDTENATFTYSYGHFGLLTKTENKQYELIQ
ncbi:lipase [Aliikangiella marina]|uniref:Lipase n=1 Tax=Aliikangiella marina TaxID=1712262 RepID=A0A545TDB9_9GAMM|nr:lipase [Aliikangiella marina]TQV75181.1 lipase [Aliikangiella marina]